MIFNLHCVHDELKNTNNYDLSIKGVFKNKNRIKFDNIYAYHPFINSHDHLISTWWPRAKTKEFYNSSKEWINDFKETETYNEFKLLFENENIDDFTLEQNNLSINLGIYKNIFSGVFCVHDHIPNQCNEYYDNRQIEIIKKYNQIHSIEFFDMWNDTKKYSNDNTFILHLLEGKKLNINENEISKEFETFLNKYHKKNSIIVHGIKLSKAEIIKCFENDITICCCPVSNDFLYNEILDIENVLKNNVNLIIGTDSLMTGGISLFEELRMISKKINPKILFKMITKNPIKAFSLNYSMILKNNCENVLLIDKIKKCPYENLLYVNPENIKLFVYKSKPILGDLEFLNFFDFNTDDYFYFNNDRFVIDDLGLTLKKINEKIKYKKRFPFIN